MTLPRLLVNRSLNLQNFVSRNQHVFGCSCMLSSSSFPAHFELLIDPKKMNSSNRKEQSQHNKGPSRAHRFVDRIRVRAQGGYGGKGSFSMQPVGRKHKFRPDGGHGGQGGSVILVASAQHQHQGSSGLERIQHHIMGEKGGNGTSQQCHGRNGHNTIVQVPCGVVVKKVKMMDYNAASSSMFESSSDSNSSSGTVEFVLFDSEEDLDEFERDTVPSQMTEVIADLDHAGAFCVVAKGGRGGFGTCRYASDHGPLPQAHVLVDNARGQPGEIEFLELELKLIGDVGLVGFPNAGKSSTLRALSRAKPKVAPYPFTTLHPILGCVEYRDGFQVRVADIPGLMDGASQGRGRGIDFLRHVERTKALLYVLDASTADPKHDLKILVQELDAYNSTLLSRQALIVANKVDLMEPERLLELLDQLERVASYLGIRYEHPVMGISAGVTGQGLVELSAAIREVVEPSKIEREIATMPEVD